MKPISSQELRKARNDFRESKKHIHLPEASLVGGKESTAMFTIAGMQQLIPYLSGKKHPLGTRLYNIQKCIRTVDIDEVGDASHLTFFNMMGNRSLGDYFKKEAVEWSREFLVDVLKFDPKKLAVTVFEGDADAPRDEETPKYRKKVGMPEHKIAYLPADNNRRSPGPVGPCGPDTEIFYRVGKSEFPPENSHPGNDDDNRLEIRNNVFMEFYRSEEKKEDKRLEEKQLIDKKTEKIIGICINLHKKYGNALIEKQYRKMVSDLLEKEGFVVVQEKKIEIIENEKNYGYRYIDLVVDKDIFIEFKNTANDGEIKKGFKQLRSYLNLHGGKVGLLINFGSDKLGINRLNSSLIESDQSPQTSVFSKLPQRNVDTGMGFERMAKVLQEKETVYETDLFWPIIQLIEKHLGIKYIGNERRMRIIADHLRTSFFLIHDGITPSNEGRGYVLRRLIRRMFYNLILLKEVSEKESADLIEDIMNRVADNFEGTSFEVKNICKVLLKETTQFQKTITNGQKLLKELFEKNKDKRLITSADAFKLYDSCGFPFELTLELANEHGFKVDQKGFEKEMEAQQERSRAGSKDMFKQGVDRSKHVEGMPPTKFVGYGNLYSEDVKLLKDFEVNPAASDGAGSQRILIFDTTPLCGEGGGQMGDSGKVILDSGEELIIKDVKKYEGVFLHFVQNSSA